MTLTITHRDQLHEGGFAGLREHQLVMEPRLFGRSRQPGDFSGIGRFVYLADARFMPFGQTNMHSHREIDVISIVVDGRIQHAGSLGEGTELIAPDVQVQRAGGEGFTHNEINPDGEWNRMIQLWAVPPNPGQSAGYRVYNPAQSSTTRVYGGHQDQSDTFDNSTHIDVVRLAPGETTSFQGDFIAYVITGSGRANEFDVADGDLLRGGSLELEASEELQLALIHEAGNLDS